MDYEDTDNEDNLSRSGPEEELDEQISAMYRLEDRYAALLQRLVNSGGVEIMALDYSRSYVSEFKFQPNTTLLDKSEFYLATKLAAGLAQQPKGPQSISSMIVNREKGLGFYSGFSYATKNKISHHFLPNSMSPLDNYNGKVFCGIFSKNGKFFLTASKERLIRLYNAETPNYKLVYNLLARDVGWSIIDVDFNPDQDRFVYSSWSSSLHLCSVSDRFKQEPLCLTDTNRRFCVFSVVFSSCGREILGGANDGCLYIYDLQRNTRKLKIPAHDADVNSVSFADDSSHIIYSGGDDALIKVWDRRTLDESQAKPVGILAGHMDGITYVDSRGDGRHLISNSKDQSIKLWDVRVFSGDSPSVPEQTWDYRWQQVPKKLLHNNNKLKDDTSIMTYKGHVVIKTLLRCRFSPIETTGQRYIYTGSGAADLIIYDALTGNIVEFVRGHKACVRDVAWHPYRNEILTSSWDGTVGYWTYSSKEELEEQVCTDNAQADENVRHRDKAQ